MNNPKRHHTTPQLVLKGFADGDGYLYVFDRRTPARGVFQEHYDSVCVLNQFYSYRLPDGRRDPSPEHWFSRLESLTAPVFTRVVEAARAGQVADLSAQEFGIMETFVYHQWKRSPETINASMLSIFDKAVDESVAEFEASYRPITDEERKLFTSPEFRARLKHNARVKASVLPGGEALQMFHRLGLVVMRIAHRRKSFITASRPVAKLSTPGAIPGSTDVEFWLPIATDVALVWGGPPMVRYGELADERLIRSLNAAIARQSTVIAGRSKELIGSLARTEQMHDRAA